MFLRMFGRNTGKGGVSPEEVGGNFWWAVRSGRRGARRCGHRMALGLTIGCLFAGSADADVKPDKSGYTLFNPTPEALMRDMTTDRPDITETPFTIDAGHLQIESDVFGHAVSRRDGQGVQSRGHNIITTNFRLGLTNWSELSVVVRPYNAMKTSAPDPADVVRHSGMGGIDLRVKLNLWGNDTFEKPGDTAFALLPFVTIPTDRDNGINPPGVEGGMSTMFAIQLSEKFSLGVNNAFGIVRNDDGPGTHTEWLSTASLAYGWSETFSTYYEVVARFNTQDTRGDPVQVAAGFTYKLRKNLQLDGGILFGVTPAADRINPLVGISARF